MKTLKVEIKFNSLFEIFKFSLTFTMIFKTFKKINETLITIIKTLKTMIKYVCENFNFNVAFRKSAK